MIYERWKKEKLRNKIKEISAVKVLDTCCILRSMCLFHLTSVALNNVYVVGKAKQITFGQFSAIDSDQIAFGGNYTIAM